MLHVDAILNEANEMLGRKKPDIGIGTVLVTAQTRDMVLANIENLEETMEMMLMLLRQLDMLDDQAFITTAVARTLQIINEYSSDVLDVMEET